MYDLAFADFQSPAGRPAPGLGYRLNTSDWNTLNACLNCDEYHLPANQGGVFVDIGSHIGGWAVAAALDNPDATVVAIEALPENVELLRRNTERFGVLVIGRAAGDGQPVSLGYGPLATETGRIHHFIGSAERGDAPDVRQVTVPGISLAELVATYGPIRMLKIDCEGCEYPLLDSPAIGEVQEIVGEVHFGWQRLVEILSATHEVTGDGKDFGAFAAVRR